MSDYNSYEARSTRALEAQAQALQEQADEMSYQRCKQTGEDYDILSTIGRVVTTYPKASLIAVGGLIAVSLVYSAFDSVGNALTPKVTIPPAIERTDGPDYGLSTNKNGDVIRYQLN